ncbi:MAG: hypothetical protein ACI4U5_03510 [Bacilli bacterium]
MKKYVKMIPIMIYPYAYLVYFIFFLIIGGFSSLDDNEVLLEIFFIIPLIYNAISLVIVLINMIQGIRGKYTLIESSRINALTKCVQIPGYIFHFFLGFIGFFMSIWGIGFIIWAIIIDLLCIIFTGISSLGMSIRLIKEKVFPLSQGILILLGLFVYVVDVVLAIYLLIYLDRREKDSTVR